MRLLTSLLALAWLALPQAFAQPAYQSSQQMDDEFAKSGQGMDHASPEFISPLVDHLPKSATVPSPKDVLGYYIGAPKKLTYYADMLKYYRALAAKSPRVKIDGHRQDATRAAIASWSSSASDESIRNLETYREYLAQLADPRKLSDAQAREIIAKAKPDLSRDGRPAQRRNRPVGNADGAGLSPGDRRHAADQEDPRQRDRYASRPPPSPTAATATSTGITTTRSTTPASRTTWVPARPTGASTFSTTTIATSIIRR